MEIIITDDKILVELIIEEEKAKSKILLSEEVKRNLGKAKEYKKGKVLGVGPGITGVTMQVKKEDQILFHVQSGIQIEVEDKSYLVMRQADILVILRS